MAPSNDAEEEYFRKVEADQRAAQRAKLARAAIELAAFGTEKPEVGERIRALGFADETAAAFHLLPLVFVAWADGSITRRERLAIFKALEARGHDASSPAGKHLAVLLEEMPSNEYRDEALALLREIVGERYQAGDVLKLCSDVADASGGLLGFRSISPAEWQAMKEIADAIGGAASEG